MGNYFSTTSKRLENIDVQGTLRKLANQNVRLLNFYKEIPVSYVARFIDYDKEGVACLMCHPIQAKLMDIDRYTILRYQDYSFKASVVGIRRHSQTADNQQEILLSRFLPVEVHTDMRQLLRVVNSPSLAVTISCAGMEFHTEMLDTSSTSFKALTIPDLPIAIGDKALASFLLPLSGTPTRIEAEVVLFKSDSDHQIFTINISRAQESLIMKYINQRQVEIIKELNQD
jgi:hypothetical protein